MSREKTLAKNTIIITIGKLCTQMITFFLLPLYTGLLTTSEYGTVDFLNTLVSLALPIITFQVEQAIFRELIEVRDSESKKTGIISSGIFTVLIQLSIYLIMFFLISPFINNNYKYFLATNVVTYILLSLFQQIARGLGDNKRYAIGSFITALTTIIFNILFIVFLKFGAYGMLLGMMLGQIIGSIYLIVTLKITKYIRIKEYKKEIIKKLWKYSIPLIPNALSWWVFNASDRVIATFFLGVDQNGILAAALKFSTLYITFYNIFNMSWTESISASINDKDVDNYFNKMFNIIMKLFISMAVGLIAVMPFVFKIMINSKFNSGYGLVPISIIASLFNVVVGLISVIYIGKKNTRAIANTSILSALINIVIHLCLIKYIGLYAAVISTLCAFLIMSIYRIIDVNKRYFKIKINKEILLNGLIAITIVTITYYLNNVYLNIISIIIAILFAYLINKDSIKIIMTFVKKKSKSS